MKMVGNFTGRAGERETSRCSDAGEKPKFVIKASATTHTAKSSTTPAFLGEHAQKMHGVVFHLQTNIDNSMCVCMCVCVCVCVCVRARMCVCVLLCVFASTGVCDCQYGCV